MSDGPILQLITSRGPKLQLTQRCESRGPILQFTHIALDHIALDQFSLAGLGRLPQGLGCWVVVSTPRRG